MKKKIKQIKYKFIEFILYKKYCRKIPKGLYLNIKELVIVLGQLTELYRLNHIDDEVVDISFELVNRRLGNIEKYIYILQNANCNCTVHKYHESNKEEK